MFKIFESRVSYIVALFSCLLLSGCNSGSVAPPKATENVEAQQREVSERLLESAVDMLNRLDDYDEGQIESAVGQVVRRLNESFAAGVLDAEQSEPFELEDGKTLRELVWLREAGEYAVGDETDPLARAQRLADWTVRNIQLIPADAPAAERLPYLPWHIMLLGRGTEFDRAWLFSLLARQQGLDVVLITPGEDTAQVVPALLHDGRLVPFDIVSGLPDERRDFAGKVVFDSSSNFISKRFERLERQLTGDSKLVLSLDIADLTAKLKKCPGVKEVVARPIRDERFAASREKAAFDALVEQLKPFRAPPIEGGSRMTTSPLWRARVRHITGKYVFAEGGGIPLTRLYQEARPAESELVELRSNSDIWTYAYRIKQNATYWLGLLSYDLQNYETAVQYLELVLKDKANGGWTAGARYNLGRTYEAWGKPDEAIKTYRATFLDLPPDAACLMRAERLEKVAKPLRNSRKTAF